MMRWLAGALLLAALGTGAARADDVGPTRGIREVRGALPVMLARRLHATGNTTPVRTVDVVVDKDRALASWTAGDASGLVYLEYRLARWWMKAEANTFDDDGDWSFEPAGSLPLCRDLHASGPTSAELIGPDFAIARDLVDLARSHVTQIARADALASVPHASRAASILTSSACTVSPVTGDDYQATIAEPPRATWKPLDPTFHGRAPTDGEMNGAGADAIFFFSRDIDGAKGFSFPAHTKLDIWCPFVLDPEVRYSLTLVGGDPIVGPIDGTMSDNTMHFDLPAFSAAPGAELRGEIDWLPQRQR
jgi:hypothetical protein